MVVGLCRALLRDATEAEDAAQQVFLSAHRSLLNGSVPREPAAWLATIARNECWARISGRMREPLATDAADDVAAPDDPVAAAIRNADLAALWRAIRALPHAQREALLLREFGGLRYDELAVALAVSEPAVESLLFRARGRLRAQLEAAYAALSGASWLEPIARLLAGGGAPAVATKAVALTLGAAAVTGGAVIAPDVIARHDPSRPARTHTTPRPVPEAMLQLPTTRAAAAVHGAAAVPPAATVERRRERGRGSSDGGGEGGDRATTTTEPREQEHKGRAVTTTEQEHGGIDTSGPSSESGSGSGSDSGSSTDSGSGSSGSDGGGSSDGGGTPVTTDVVTTVPLPTVSVSDGSDG